MHKICHYVDFNMQNMQNTCAKYADICIKNTKCVQKYAQNMQQICCYTQKYAQSALLRHQHAKHAEHAQKNLQKYAKNVCRKHA